MRSVADGVEHREAVLVFSADDSIYLSDMPFYHRGKKARIRETGLRLILAPPAILLSSGGQGTTTKHSRASHVSGVEDSKVCCSGLHRQ
jgi:hypothetical protein